MAAWRRGYNALLPEQRGSAVRFDRRIVKSTVRRVYGYDGTVESDYGVTWLSSTPTGCKTGSAPTLLELVASLQTASLSKQPIV